MELSEFNEFKHLYDKLDNIIEAYVRYNYQGYSIQSWKILGDYYYEVCLHLINLKYHEEIEFISIDDLLSWTERNGV